MNGVIQNEIERDIEDIVKKIDVGIMIDVVMGK
jgi:hypothetical protein